MHWHRSVKEWLPPGGHVDPNEDPVQAVLREIKEETGIDVELVATHPKMTFEEPIQLEPPYAVLVEDVTDRKYGLHQHVDFIYFTRPLVSEQINAPEGFTWVSESQLRKRVPLMSPFGMKSPPDDVVELGLHALRVYEENS